MLLWPLCLLVISGREERTWWWCSQRKRLETTSAHLCKHAQPTRKRFSNHYSLCWEGCEAVYFKGLPTCLCYMCERTFIFSYHMFISMFTIQMLFVCPAYLSFYYCCPLLVRSEMNCKLLTYCFVTVFVLFLSIAHFLLLEFVGLTFHSSSSLAVSKIR